MKFGLTFAIHMPQPSSLFVHYLPNRWDEMSQGMRLAEQSHGELRIYFQSRFADNLIGSHHALAQSFVA